MAHCRTQGASSMVYHKHQGNLDYTARILIRHPLWRLVTALLVSRDKKTHWKFHTDIWTVLILICQILCLWIFVTLGISSCYTQAEQELCRMQKEVPSQQMIQQTAVYEGTQIQMRTYNNNAVHLPVYQLVQAPGCIVTIAYSQFHSKQNKHCK